MLNDPIADMLTRIRNATQQKHRYVDIRKSKMATAILAVLKEAGFIADFVANDEERLIRVFLRYGENRTCMISGLTRISKPGRRIYVGWPDVPVIQKGIGLSIISTSKGIMSGRRARNEKIGGELICTIW